MIFSGLTFLYMFLPSVLLFYWLARSIPSKNLILTIFSLLFYAWGEPVYVFLMLATAYANYALGLLINRYKQTAQSKLFLILAVTLDLSLLGLFKYAGFLIENINEIFGFSLAVPNIALPIGISFYTFQTLSYVIDLYMGKVEVQRSFLKLLMYICLFPQLIAGPIVRYSVVESELSIRTFSFEDFGYGAKRFCVGLAKKVILANNCGAVIVTLFSAADQLSVLSYWAAMVFFTFQIYFDFSGYSDMAIGLGRMFGFKFLENFNYPYLSKSITEFWRRWHISLGTFFRDYVYIPLGGNRKHQYLNLFLVWVLTGLWHGANWNFVIWGLSYGVLIMLERLFLKNVLEQLPAVLVYGYMAFVTVVLWTVFYFTDTSQLIAALNIMFGNSTLPGVNYFAVTVIKDNFILLLAAFVFSFPIADRLFNRLFCCRESKFAAAWPVTSTLLLISSLILCTLFLLGSTYNPFLYFRF
jgi:alginate O-acetyltransferase complex protein AlgI